MKSFFLLPIAFVALAVPVAVMAGSGESGFDGVVHSIESRYHVHATQIPFMGLVSLVSKKASHGGVGSLHVAEFDSFTEQVDGNELNQLVEQKLGEGWERMIRETSRKGHEQTLIFIHPEGDRMGMFVVDLDGSEMHVVEVSVDPKHLDEDMGQYTHYHHGNDSDKDNDGDQDDQSR
jgi:hypothetical protein